MFEKFVEAYKFVDEHGSFTDDPWTRLGRLLLKFLRDPTLPIVVLGGLVAEYIKWTVGSGELVVVQAFIVAEVVALVLYAVGDEVAEALEAAKKTYEEDDSTSQDQ